MGSREPALHARRMLRRLFVVSLAVLGACAPSASEGEDAEVAGDALVAGSGIAGPVEVGEDRLVVQRAGNESLVGVRPGRVLVGGPRDANGTGFLRKATGSELDGDRIVVRTEPAALTDLLRSADVETRGPLDTPAARAGDLEPSALSPESVGARGPAVGVDIDDVTLLSVHGSFTDPTKLLPVQSFELSREVRIAHGHVRFRPTVTTSLAIRHGKLARFEAIARGEIDAALDVVVDSKTSLDLDKNRLYEEKLRPYLRASGLSLTLWESEPYPLPVQWIGVVPVVETVRVRVEATCDVAMTAEMHAEASFALKSEASFGARFRDGSWSAADPPVLDASAKLEMTRKDAFEGRCGLRIELGFYFYDLAGPTLSLSPYLAFETKRAGGLATFAAWPGLRGALGGRMQVLGWELLGADVPLFDARSQTPLRGAW